MRYDQNCGSFWTSGFGWLKFVHNLTEVRFKNVLQSTFTMDSIDGIMPVNRMLTTIMIMAMAFSKRIETTAAVQSGFLEWISVYLFNIHHPARFGFTG